MARVKLDEAAFFLKNLEDQRPTSEEFRYYLVAFLQACGSVPDWLLYEYGEIFLGFTIEDEIHERDFGFAARTAKRLGDGKPAHFLDWWRAETEKLRNSPAGKVLLKKRNVVVHRGTPRFSVALLMFEIKGIAENPSILGIRSSTIVPSKGPASPDIVAEELYFADHDDKSVLDYCREFYQALEDYVDRAERRFKFASP